MTANKATILNQLDQIITIHRKKSAKNSYVAQMNAQGIDKMLEKITEETTEVLLAVKNNDKNNLVDEMADLWFHCLLVLNHQGLNSQDILAELKKRMGTSGIDEKNLRDKNDS